MKIGVMNDPSASVYDEIRAIAEAGYDYVDFTVESPKALTFDTRRVRSLLDQYGLFIVGHTDPCLPYAYPIEGVRRACLKELERCAKIFSTLRATTMNIHPCYSCPPGMKQRLVELNAEALKPVVEMADSYGLTVVFENYKDPFDCVSTYGALTERVPGLKVHLDFGHANIGKDNAETFCNHLGRHIMHVHFSDNRSTDDHHMPLGVGSIDWEKAVQALKAIGYDGTITLEVFCDDSRVVFQYLGVSRQFLLELWNG
jgi:sugar phosphate isomerase/epimerase